MIDKSFLFDRFWTRYYRTMEWSILGCRRSANGDIIYTAIRRGGCDLAHLQYF